MNIDVFDLIEWILKHRKGTDAFQKYPEWVIRDLVLDTAKTEPNSQLLVYSDNEGISGVCLIVLKGKNTLYISQLLTSKREAFVELMRKIVQEFPECVVAAYRGQRGIRMYSNTARLFRLLERIT